MDIELFSMLCSWGSFSYHGSVKHNLRFQQLVSHIHSCFYFIFIFIVIFLTRRAAVISSTLPLCRACEFLLSEVRRKEKRI